jgi:hypothetical protein
MQGKLEPGLERYGITSLAEHLSPFTEESRVYFEQKGPTILIAAQIRTMFSLVPRKWEIL